MLFDIHSQKSRGVLSALLGGVVLCFMIFSAWNYYHAQKQKEALDTFYLWIEKQRYQNEMLSHIGYGEMIHHFNDHS